METKITKKRTSTYETWRGAKERCTKSYHKNYEAYGGVGITFCERWMSYSNFLEDMGERPEGTTLDRIDNKLGYCKENCRWTSRLNQSRNTGPRRKAKKSNASKFKCVSFHKKLGKWRARITDNGKRISLGCFDSETEAAAAYNEAAKRIFGEFAFLNVIEP